MGTAYTPGLTISSSITIRKIRRLPTLGDVLVNKGDRVTPDVVVARTQIPGPMQTVRVAEILGLEPEEAISALMVKEGQEVQANEIIAKSSSFFGLIKSEAKSPITGTIELISPATGHVGVRSPSKPVEVKAYIDGTVVEVLPNEGVVVETTGALVQGIFGIGGERYGELVVPDALNGKDIGISDLNDSMAGKILVGSCGISGDALKKAAHIGLVGVVVGAVIDTDLISYLGYDIGVAITGQEDIVTTVILTEGFGDISMSSKTWKLLKTLEGSRVSLNGATQIRAGVIRPEIVVGRETEISESAETKVEHNLVVGATVRMIREPYFGQIGRVTGLPPEAVVIETGAVVRVLEAELADGNTVQVPRANVEIIAG